MNPGPSSQPTPEVHHVESTFPRLVLSQPSVSTRPMEQHHEDLFVELGNTPASMIPNTEADLKRKSQDQEDDFNVLESEECLNLIEVAFRTFLGDMRARIIPGVKLIADHCDHKLADISPLLFSPGYRQV